MKNLDKLKEEIKGMNAEEMARFLDNRCEYCAYHGKKCAQNPCIAGVKEYLLQGMPKKYYWRLNIPEVNMNSTIYKYLNIRIDNLMRISTNVESEIYRTKFTEEEYKELPEKYGFPFDMFVKEEIEE